jgi:hypothetical protein
MHLRSYRPARSYAAPANTTVSITPVSSENLRVRLRFSNLRRVKGNGEAGPAGKRGQAGDQVPLEILSAGYVSVAVESFKLLTSLPGLATYGLAKHGR